MDGVKFSMPARKEMVVVNQDIQRRAKVYLLVPKVQASV